MKEYERASRFTDISPEEFMGETLSLFRFQYAENPVYRNYCQLLRKDPAAIHTLTDIPFLPISLFKSHAVVCGTFTPECCFESSGTTGNQTSRHFVKELSLYEKSFLKGFTGQYGDPSRYCILALLPAYLERQHSSLVLMADRLIRASGHPRSGFYLHNQDELAACLQELEAAQQPTLLLGVTFALLDFAAAHPFPLKHTIVMETGGMKGRRAEMTREAVHEILSRAFHLQQIHSEYGMTELLSQAYSSGHGLFQCPPWMRVLVREEDDPFALSGSGEKIRSGAANIIDLANVYSCAFIATDDAARLHPDGRFEILGRLDHSDIRGCSLLTA